VADDYVAKIVDLRRGQPIRTAKHAALPDET
jgi:hypothetical protein